MRSTKCWNEARVWKRQPVATFTSSTPRSFQSSRSSSSRRRIVSAPRSSSNRRRRSATARGAWLASSAASRIFFTSFVLSMGHAYVNGGEGLRLRHLDEALAHQLEHREEVHHQHGDAA